MTRNAPKWIGVVALFNFDIVFKFEELVVIESGFGEVEVVDGRRVLVVGEGRTDKTLIGDRRIGLFTTSSTIHEAYICFH